MKISKKTIVAIAIILIGATIGGIYSYSKKKKTSEFAAKEFVPIAPDYADSTMWFCAENDSEGNGADVFYIVSTWELDWQTTDGQTSHYADVHNENHRNDMAIEIRKIAEYMADGNNFYAPYYRHITLDSWATQNEDTIHRRAQIAMADVKNAFDLFLKKRDNSRPFILAGFSQGGMAVVELLKYMDDETYSHLVAAYVLGYKVTPQDTLQSRHLRAAKDSIDIGVTICYNTVKDIKYVQPILCNQCIFCINPVNWLTDDTPAVLHDSIIVTVNPEHHVLVVKNYAGSEYKPIMGFINVGDIHSCEPWLYSTCLKRNIALRTREWRKAM